MEAFEAVLNLELEKNAGTPVVWKKATPDKAGALAMGKSMLTAFYESIDLSGYAVVDVELPLSARLYTDDGLPTEFMLVGILDLLLMDENSEAVVVDNKTAAQPMSQAFRRREPPDVRLCLSAGRQQVCVSHRSGEMPVRCR
jgi:putative RecB family exonuclease